MKNFLLLSMLVVLSGCTTTKYETVYKYVNRPAPVAPKTTPATMKPVQWKVLTKAELEKVLKDLETNPDPNFVLFALTSKGFENISTNLAEINRFIREQNQVITYYQAYVKDTDVLPTEKNKK